MKIKVKISNESISFKKRCSRYLHTMRQAISRFYFNFCIT